MKCPGIQINNDDKHPEFSGCAGGTDCPVCRGAGLIAPITWVEYRERARTTAVYPEVLAKGPDGNVLSHPCVYPALKLSNEIGELLDATTQADICKELGDCCWYVAAFPDPLHPPFRLDNVSQVNAALAPSLAKCSQAALVINGVVGKRLRDGIAQSLEQVYYELETIFKAFCNIAALCDTTIEDVLLGNLRKLRSRAERGVIRGNGDNR